MDCGGAACFFYFFTKKHSGAKNRFWSFCIICSELNNEETKKAD